MTGFQAALAVFVKTPGNSPVKTRLAVGIGLRRAEEFFRLSLAAVEATVAAIAEAGNIQPYWAVAEESGLSDPRWRHFARIHQGAGGLAERLGHVFQVLQRRHAHIVAIGADSPQIIPRIVQSAFETLRRADAQQAHVVGRCHDGGFYLVGSNCPLPVELWHDVPYSTPAAADRLAALLARLGAVYELDRQTDVDQLDDLPVLRAELNALTQLSSEQQAVLDWVEATLASSVPKPLPRE